MSQSGGRVVAVRGARKARMIRHPRAMTNATHPGRDDLEALNEVRSYPQGNGEWVSPPIVCDSCEYDVDAAVKKLKAAIRTIPEKARGAPHFNSMLIALSDVEAMHDVALDGLKVAAATCQDCFVSTVAHIKLARRYEEVGDTASRDKCIAATRGMLKELLVRGVHGAKVVATEQKSKSAARRSKQRVKQGNTKSDSNTQRGGGGVVFETKDNRIIKEAAGSIPTNTKRYHASEQDLSVDFMEKSTGCAEIKTWLTAHTKEWPSAPGNVRLESPLLGLVWIVSVCHLCGYIRASHRWLSDLLYFVEHHGEDNDLLRWSGMRWHTYWSGICGVVPEHIVALLTCAVQDSHARDIRLKPETTIKILGYAKRAAGMSLEAAMHAELSKRRATENLSRSEIVNASHLLTTYALVWGLDTQYDMPLLRMFAAHIDKTDMDEAARASHLLLVAWIIFVRTRCERCRDNSASAHLFGLDVDPDTTVYDPSCLCSLDNFWHIKSLLHNRDFTRAVLVTPANIKYLMALAIELVRLALQWDKLRERVGEASCPRPLGLHKSGDGLASRAFAYLAQLCFRSRDVTCKRMAERSLKRFFILEDPVAAIPLQCDSCGTRGYESPVDTASPVFSPSIASAVAVGVSPFETTSVSYSCYSEKSDAQLVSRNQCCLTSWSCSPTCLERHRAEDCISNPGVHTFCRGYSSTRYYTEAIPRTQLPSALALVETLTRKSVSTLACF